MSKIVKLSGAFVKPTLVSKNNKVVVKYNVINNLSLLMKQRKITRKQLAKKLKVTYTQAWRWETAQAYPNTENLLKLRVLFSKEDLRVERNDFEQFSKRV